MYKACLCDDDKAICTRLEKIIIQFAIQANIEIDVMHMESANGLLVCNYPYDILFLDIRFHGENIGINIAEELRKNGNTAIIVLITSYEQMSIDGYRAEPFRFIVKPFTDEQIFLLLRSCIEKIERRGRYVNIKHESHSELVRADRILYIYSKDRKRHVVMEASVCHTWQSLSELMDALPSDLFVYVNKSVVVNLASIDTVRKATITLVGGKTVPIGNYYRDSFNKSLRVFMRE